MPYFEPWIRVKGRLLKTLGELILDIERQIIGFYSYEKANQEP